MVVLALVGCVLGAPSPASACSVAWPGPTEQEQLARAALVFEGVALSSREPNIGAPIRSSADPIIWTFAVDREIKGSTVPRQEISTAGSGASCGFTFKTGVRYRVFAVEQGGIFMTGLGSGTTDVPLVAATASPSPNPIAPGSTEDVWSVTTISVVVLAVVLLLRLAWGARRRLPRWPGRSVGT